MENVKLISTVAELKITIHKLESQFGVTETTRILYKECTRLKAEMTTQQWDTAMESYKWRTNQEGKQC